MNKNLDVIEMMLFLWESVKNKEKVSDVYLNDIAKRDELKVLFSDDFNEESVRKVLSAIVNTEMLSKRTKSEGLFWNNNMWMCEDLSVTHAMVTPIKQLNVDNIESDYELVFIPGLSELYYVDDKKIYINFFKIMVDVFTGSMDVTINDLPVEEFINQLVVDL